jgi:hypothetical protein
VIARDDWVYGAEQELARSAEDPEAAARSQVYLRAIHEQLHALNEQIADLRRLQKQTRDRTF